MVDEKETNMSKSYVYVARGENSGEPESYILGAYATQAEAEARLKALIAEDTGLEYMWVEKMEIGKAMFLSNR